MKTSKYLFFALFSLTLVLAPACKNDADPGFLTLNLTYQVDGAPLEFDSFKYQALAGHVYNVVRLKYYISDIILVEENGNSFMIDLVHYGDARDAASKNISLGEVKNGTYRSISFIFGLDESRNIDGGLDNTLENINMEWPIPGDQGYHYMKLEGKYDSLGTGVIKNYNIHTGATGGNQNYLTARLEIPPMVVNGNNWEINLSMDINEWFQNPNTYDFAEFGQMIMMNQAAQKVLKENGNTVFAINSINVK